MLNRRYRVRPLRLDIIQPDAIQCPIDVIRLETNEWGLYNQTPYDVDENDVDPPHCRAPLPQNWIPYAMANTNA